MTIDKIKQMNFRTQWGLASNLSALGITLRSSSLLLLLLLYSIPVHKSSREEENEKEEGELFPKAAKRSVVARVNSGWVPEQLLLCCSAGQIVPIGLYTSMKSPL